MLSERLLAGACSLDLKAVASEVGLHGATDGRLVVDDQDARAGRAAHAGPLRAAVITGGNSPSGRVNAKRVPPSGRFSAQIRPPCASTNPLATASPRPVPWRRGSTPPTW